MIARKIRRILLFTGNHLRSFIAVHQVLYRKPRK